MLFAATSPAISVARGAPDLAFYFVAVRAVARLWARDLRPHHGQAKTRRGAGAHRPDLDPGQWFFLCRSAEFAELYAVCRGHAASPRHAAPWLELGPAGAAARCRRRRPRRRRSPAVWMTSCSLQVPSRAVIPPDSTVPRRHTQTRSSRTAGRRSNQVGFLGGDTPRPPRPPPAAEPVLAQAWTAWCGTGALLGPGTHWALCVGCRATTHHRLSAAYGVPNEPWPSTTH